MKSVVLQIQVWNSLLPPFLRPSPVFAIHFPPATGPGPETGAEDPTARARAYEKFCKSPPEEGAILLATDVAARGIDVEKVEWIVQVGPGSRGERQEKRWKWGDEEQKRWTRRWVFACKS